MKVWVKFCLAFCFAVSLRGACHAAGLEAAEKAEEIIARCKQKNILARPACLSANLSRKWRYELGYAGQSFWAIGQLATVRRSLAGNYFAFVTAGNYRVACKVTIKMVALLKRLGDQRVLIKGVLQGYHLTFNLHRFHHLRLTPYCLIEAAV